MANIFGPLKDRQAGVLKSASWYRNAVQGIVQKATATGLMRSGKLNSRPSAGRLNMYFYDPKTKKKLPYYDTFPLVLPVDTFRGGFVGLNFHYLPFLHNLFHKNDNNIHQMLLNVDLLLMNNDQLGDFVFL